MIYSYQKHGLAIVAIPVFATHGSIKDKQNGHGIGHRFLPPFTGCAAGTSVDVTAATLIARTRPQTGSCSALYVSEPLRRHQLNEHTNKQMNV